MDELSYHETRFRFDGRREILWKALCSAYFNNLVQVNFHVLELGAGNGHFINNIRCERKSAIDQWPGFAHYLKPEVKWHIGSITDLGFVADGSVDFVFASNIFEHLSQGDLARTLAEVRKKLAPRGSMNILQPNYRLAYREYFDDYTHITVYSDVGMCDFLAANGFEVIKCIPGFMPFSLKSSKAPVRPWLIKLYLCLPYKPWAKQMFIRARLRTQD
jgi:hypothetical protein